MISSLGGEDMSFQITILFVADIEFEYIAGESTEKERADFFETMEQKNAYTSME